MDLRKQCQQFAVDLLDQTRTSNELAIILNHDPDLSAYQFGDRMSLHRLTQAIYYKQKTVYIIRCVRERPSSFFKMFSFSVCGARKHSTAAIVHLVWRFAWISAQNSVRQDAVHSQGGPAVSHVLSDLYGCPQLSDWPVDAQALHEISNTRLLLLVLLM